MNTEQILTSMSRYIHAFYDVEVKVSGPNLHIELKRFMDEMQDDTLTEYWDEYMSSIKPNTQKTNNVDGLHDKPVTYYRGVKVSAVSESENSTNSSMSSGGMYRGQKL